MRRILEADGFEVTEAKGGKPYSVEVRRATVRELLRYLVGLAAGEKTGRFVTRADCRATIMLLLGP